MISNRILTSAAIVLISAQITPAAEVKKKARPAVSRQDGQAVAQRARIAEIRKRLLERKLASRDALKQLLAEDEKKLTRESADYEIKKRDYQRRLVSQGDLAKSAQAVSRTRAEIERLQQWIAEDDAALTLAGYVRREQQEPIMEAPRGSTITTAYFIRYNGTGDWSLNDAGKIGKFFFDHFGHALPISAKGQSETHDRMGLDHRDAMDVAVQPDSSEGRGLMAYLRKLGIPFIAFRNRVRGMATGAHIHIGRPSLRLTHAPLLSSPPAAEEKEG